MKFVKTNICKHVKSLAFMKLSGDEILKETESEFDDPDRPTCDCRSQLSTEITSLLFLGPKQEFLNL